MKRGMAGVALFFKDRFSAPPLGINPTKPLFYLTLLKKIHKLHVHLRYSLYTFFFSDTQAIPAQSCNFRPNQQKE
jgi:hypothetical protein